MELPVSTENALMNGLQYAYPYAILSAYEEAKPWIAENYIYISLLKPKVTNSIANFMGYIDGYTYTNDARPNEILVSNSIDTFMLSSRNLMDIIAHYLDDGYYIVLFVDEYYLPSCNMYKRQHMLHEQLLYGYDKSKKTILALGLDHSALFSRICHNYSDIVIAFDKGLTCTKHGNPEWAGRNRLICLKPAERLLQYTYSADVFVNKISHYITGDLTERELYAADWVYPGHLYVGMSYFEYLLTDLIVDSDYYFRNIHHLYEHKRMMVQSISYFEKGNGNFNTKNSVLYKEKVLNPIYALRNRLLKYLVSNKTVSMTDYTDEIKRIMEIEASLLTKICN